VKFLVAGMEDVTGHTGQTVENCWNAATRSAAIAWGPRPSIW
jgi:hypothetical protein